MQPDPAHDDQADTRILEESRQDHADRWPRFVCRVLPELGDRRGTHKDVSVDTPFLTMHCFRQTFDKEAVIVELTVRGSRRETELR